MGCVCVFREVGNGYLKSEEYISGKMESVDVIKGMSSSMVVKVTKGSRYYYRHREDILALRKEKRMEDDDFKRRYEERERKKKEKERKERERVEKREVKRRITEVVQPKVEKMATSDLK